MSIIGHTSGGSPIFAPSTNKISKGYKGKTLYDCSINPRHRLSANQAKTNGYWCTHCGAPLKVRAQKLEELRSLAKHMGFNIVPI